MRYIRLLKNRKPLNKIAKFGLRNIYIENTSFYFISLLNKSRRLLRVMETGIWTDGDDMIKNYKMTFFF